MALLLALLFLSMFISILVRGEFSDGATRYSLREHPVRFIIVTTFILGLTIFCFYRFRVDMEILR